MLNNRTETNPATTLRLLSGTKWRGVVYPTRSANMSASLKTWCLGALVAVNALLAHSLVYSWIFIYREFSYPIDFFMPINRTMTRATISLSVAAVSVPLASILYARTARELPSVSRIATIVVTALAAAVSIAFAVWRYLR